MSRHDPVRLLHGCFPSGCCTFRDFAAKLVAVLDAYNRRVVGWSMGATLDVPMTSAALKMAISRRQPKPGLILHSDRGAQFASRSYRELPANHSLVASMSRKSNCYDNAYIVSFWSSLKYETAYQRKFATCSEAHTAILDYIESFYSRVRLHSSLGYRSPIQFESQLN